jgi:hypothetical protein
MLGHACFWAWPLPKILCIVGSYLLPTWIASEDEPSFRIDDDTSEGHEFAARRDGAMRPAEPCHDRS